MSRGLLLGCFDPGGAGELAVPPGASGFADGPLRVAYGGPPAPETDLVCFFDGHLDNGLELAAELDGAAAPRPIEALLADGYQRWGRGLPARMRGDFVLLVWDRGRREGLLARDQLGARPAYLWRSGRQLRFATELPALLASLPRRPAPDEASVAHWITAGSRPGTATLYQGVERLGPGELIALGEATRAIRYWQPRYEEPLDCSVEELAARVRQGLELAVGRRLAGKGTTGVLLSGGLDSATVAAVAAAVGERERVRACSATFPDHPGADEAELIADLRAELGIGGPVAEVRAAGLLDSAREHLRAQGVPLLGWGDFWTLPLLRQAAAEGVTAVLGGDGGDELFGPRQNLIASELRRGRPRRALAAVGRLPGAGPQVPRREVASMLAGQALVALPATPHRALERRAVERDRPAWLRASTAAALRESADPLAWKRLDGPLWWAELAHGMASGLDECGIFEHQRQRAALAGVEARHPLLDLDLVSLGLRQAPGATLDPRFSRPVLREAVAGMVPDAIRLRPGKARFDSLVTDCLLDSEAAAVRSLLADPKAELGAYVDPALVAGELLDGEGAVERGSFQWMWLTWRLVTAELWLRQEAGGGSASTTTFSPLDPPIRNTEDSRSDS